MTLVLLWHRPNFGDLYALSDSRLTDRDAPLIDSAPKLYSLPIQLHSRASNGTFRAIMRGSCGFAFAGSAVTATSVFAFSATVLQDLVLPLGGNVPSLADVAEFVRRAAERYMREIGERFYPEVRGRAELLIFGHCWRTNRLRGFRLHPRLTDHFEVVADELELSPLLVTMIGDPAAMTAMAELSKLEGIRPEPERRTYGDLLNELISSGSCPTVGGHAQHMVANRAGAKPFAYLTPSPRGADQASLMLLNVPVDEMGGVGDCSVFTSVLGPWPKG